MVRSQSFGSNFINFYFIKYAYYFLSLLIKLTRRSIIQKVRCSLSTNCYNNKFQNLLNYFFLFFSPFPRGTLSIELIFLVRKIIFPSSTVIILKRFTYTDIKKYRIFTYFI